MQLGFFLSCPTGIAYIKELTYTFTVHNWTITGNTTGSPKVTSTLYIDNIEMTSTTQNIVVYNQPILPNIPRIVKCFAINRWGSDAKLLNLCELQNRK